MDIEKAPNSFLSQLGFTMFPQTFVSEYGCRCPLVRHERTHEAARAIRQAEVYLKKQQITNDLASSFVDALSSSSRQRRRLWPSS